MCKSNILKLIPKEQSSIGSCVRCAKKVNPNHRPFCSKRCAQLDLYSWLNEDYSLPAEESVNLINEE
ncbi:MAG: DNA gyrase inhibitor YacG [Rhodospirillaceae bacterium]|nr:DNA gyrase inhibitor YacG [Rhodospirillaceae bacterium]